MPDSPGAVEAGRIDVPVVADLTGFAEKLRAGVEAAAARVKANIGVTVDTTGLRRRLQEAVKTSSTNVNATAGIKWDTVGLRKRLQAAVAASSSGVNAHVGVRTDTGLLRGELRSEVLAASELVSADVDVHVNAPGLREEIRQAAQIAAEGITAFIGMNIDGTGLREEIEAWARIASAGVKAKLGVDVDDAEAAAEGAKAEKAAEAAAGDIDTELDVDTAKAEAKIAAVKAKANQGNVQLGAFDATPFERFLFRIQQFTLQVGVITTIGAALEGIGSALTGIVGGLAAAVGGLYALTAAASPAVATLAVIPNLLLAAGQGLGVLIGGFTGVGQAIGALRQQQQATGRSAVSTGQDVAAAARAQADAQRDAARQVETATRNLARAQENARLAQDNLNDARKEAKERLQDLALELVSAAIDEESAAIGLERAKERFNETAANPFATELDRREATLAYQEALHQIDVVAERNDDLAREGGELRQQGIEGSDQVVAAKRALRDANLAVVDAERAVADAYRNSARAAQAAAPAAAGLAAADQAVADAFKDLSPAAQSFARFVVDKLLPAFIDLRNEIASRLLPSVEDGLRRLLNSPLWRTLRDELLDTADGAANWFTRLIDVLAGGEFAGDVKIISDGNQRALAGFGDVALQLLNTLVDIAAVVAQEGGLLDRFTDWVEQLTAGWEETAKLNRENGSMFRFFDRAADRLGQVVRIFKNLAIGLYRIGQAGVGAGDDLLDYWEESSERFIEWAETNREKLEAWFDVVKGITIDIAALLVDITKGIAKLADDPNTVTIVKLLREQVGPAIGDFVTALQNSDVGERFSQLVTSVLDALTTLTNSGGLGILLDFLRGFFDAIVAIGRTEGGAKMLSFLLTLIGISGALSLTAGVLIRLGTGFFRIGKGLKAAAVFLLSGRFMQALRGLGGMFGLGGIAGGGGGVGGLGGKAGITGQLATIIAKMDIIIARMGGPAGKGGPGGVVGGTGGKGATARRVLGKGVRAAGGAATALFLGDLAVDWLNDNFDNGSYDAGDWWGNVLAQAGVGAATGAAAGAPFAGIGAAPGAIIGAIVGGLSGVKNSANKQADYERLRRLDPVTEVLFSQDGVTPDEASKATRKALREIAAEAYTTNRQYLGYADSVEQAQVAIDDHYRVLADAVVKATGLTEAEVADLIGTITDYNAQKIIPKRLTAVDNVSPALEQTGRNLAAYAQSNPPPKSLEAQDRITEKADRVRLKLDELDRKNVAPKTLAARDQVTEKADRVLRKISQVDEKNVRPKVLAAVDKVSPGLDQIGRNLAAYAQAKAPTKYLTFQTNVAEIRDYIARVVNSIPNTIPKNIALGITMRGANLTAQAQAYADGYTPYGMATGGTVRPTPGGTLVRLAEAGRPETVVDTGTVNEMLAELTQLLKEQSGGGPRVVVGEGAIQQTVYNPVPEKASESLSRRMRQAAEFGLAGIG